MNLNHTPSSENPENTNNPSSKKQPDSQQQSFKKIAESENKRKFNTQEVIKNTQDKLKKEKPETPEENNTQDVLKQNLSTSPKNHPHFHEEKENIQPSGMTLTCENSMKGGMIGLGGTVMSTIIHGGDICKGILSTPKDCYDLITGKAEYDGFKNA